ncbi:SDR family NAD(P)-dependent oxidoreductase [Microbacterium sp. LWH12-1.2]|uniref:SDR family NAD(P)-dependent oxidoreductase n=1 Tax=Microbacterium sp. LWH12-1.2 TaxID=3135259 RepID=UPI003423ECF7
MNTAVITGGAGGMGLATAKLLGHDHRIVIADLGRERIDDAVKELTGMGITASGVVCDVTNERSVNDLLVAAASGGNRVRAVVHTAGVSPQMGKPDLIVRINALGTANIARAFLSLADEGDVLVNVASYAGHALPAILIPFRKFPLAESDPARFVRSLVRRASLVGRKQHAGFAYALSKAYVIWYSTTLAARFGTRGARVVSVSPGSFETAMGRLEADHGAADLLKTAALKRFGKPEEIASVLAFCASEAPGYLTGTDILVDGGTRAGHRGRKRST